MAAATMAAMALPTVRLGSAGTLVNERSFGPGHGNVRVSRLVAAAARPTTTQRRPSKGKGPAGNGEPAPGPPKPERWRLMRVRVPFEDDPGKDFFDASPALLRAVSRALGCPSGRTVAAGAVRVVRKSFDPRWRNNPAYDYVVDIEAVAAVAAGARRLSARPGVMEALAGDTLPDAATTLRQTVGLPSTAGDAPRRDGVGASDASRPVVVVGSGPAGYFAALALAEAGVAVTVLEKGQPVEERGRDIGALFVRRQLDPDSNLCYGEGGAGTWSDGKLTTRIGRNSGPVRCVLQTLVRFGAPESILVAGKPHLGTDRMVRILQGFRAHLESQGAKVRFGCTVADIDVRDGAVRGVRLRGGEVVPASAVIPAVGHSARPLYEKLLEAGVEIVPKRFAMGFRIEHPQSAIDEAQYGPTLAAHVDRGKGKAPVADYRLAAEVDIGGEGLSGSSSDGEERRGEGEAVGGTGPVAASAEEMAERDLWMREHPTVEGDRWDAVKGAVGAEGPSGAQLGSDGRPMGAGVGDVTRKVARDDTRGSDEATGSRSDGTVGVDDTLGGAEAGGRERQGGFGDSEWRRRNVYSFCMCPGGQVVPTSTSEMHLCVNGMSFSRRNSRWANSALVVGVVPEDWAPYEGQHGVLAGLRLQEEMERRAATMGGGKFQAPVQRVTDFVSGRLSETLPPSSYRLGATSARLDQLYPPPITAALRAALSRFARQLDGFVHEDAVLYGVETRTSAPVRIVRDEDTLESTRVRGLYPSGEGAGYAGGIVSAAVDGLRVAGALLRARGVAAGAPDVARVQDMY